MKKKKWKPGVVRAGIAVLTAASVAAAAFLSWKAEEEMQVLGKSISASASAWIEWGKEEAARRRAAAEKAAAEPEKESSTQEENAGQSADDESAYHPSEDDEFYIGLADAIRDDLSYHIEWKEYEVSSEDGTVSAYGRYPQIKGDVINKEALNVFLEEQAIYYRDRYGQLALENEDISSCTIRSYGYVTYMDEDTLSIVMDEAVLIGEGGFVDLYAINIDLNTGTILDNTQILEYSEKLAQQFRRQNRCQNGELPVIEAMNDKELLDNLSDPENGIVYFTPVGLEIGFNYFAADNFGWVTATIKDYSGFRPKF